MLHVTNGDCAAEVIRQAGIGGEVLPWRDLLHDGPVPAGLPLEELSRVRARFIADQGWGAAGQDEAMLAERDAVLREFGERDAALRGWTGHDETVLWFEHDLYDQLQLLQVLDALGDDAGEDARLSLVCEAEYLGMVTTGRARELFERRKPVTWEQLALGRRAWEAFRAPDPTQVERLLAEDAGALSFLAAALRRHLEQFPSTRDGLSRSERQALEAIGAGAATVAEAYTASHQGREDPVWLGDATFVWYLERLCRVPHPLVELEGGGAVESHGEDPTAEAEMIKRRVTLTEAGRDVLAGRADHVRLNGIDRWLGGVHLQGREAAWRWDADAGRLARGETSGGGGR